MESLLREREEDVFTTRQEVLALERDLQNMKEGEKALRLELQRGEAARAAVEEQVQELRQRAVND